MLRAQTGSNEQAGKNGSCWQKSFCKTATGCAAKPNYTIPVGRFFSSAPCIESAESCVEISHRNDWQRPVFSRCSEKLCWH